ncbi:MAG TPA: hypothetical protein VJN02_03980 [Gammaproteobacteria bacterium]|nr:hypothetical protein [Gammaproteobacteria bacterium]
MDFIKSNFLNTTTQITVNSNTGTVSNLFNRDIYYQYFSDGLNNDLTNSSITITFAATTSVSRIAIMDTNARQFNLFYNGLTANSFALSGAHTTASQFTTNDQEFLYLKFSTLAVSSITLDILTTQTANQEKRVGLFVASDLYLTLTHIPDASGFKPRRDPKQIVHKLSDGGMRIHNVRKKWSHDISLDNLSQSLTTSLETIFDLQDPFMFCPFGTSTSWDKVLYEAVWEGDFDFYEYSDNATVSGFSGAIRLRETPV